MKLEIIEGEFVSSGVSNSVGVMYGKFPVRVMLIDTCFNWVVFNNKTHYVEYTPNPGQEGYIPKWNWDILPGSGSLKLQQLKELEENPTAFPGIIGGAGGEPIMQGPGYMATKNGYVIGTGTVSASYSNGARACAQMSGVKKDTGPMNSVQKWFGISASNSLLNLFPDGGQAVMGIWNPEQGFNYAGMMEIIQLVSTTINIGGAIQHALEIYDAKVEKGEL